MTNYERPLFEEGEKSRKLLVVATAYYPGGLKEVMGQVDSPAIGEIELVKRFRAENGREADVVDYSTRLPGVGRLEDKLKLDFAWAFKLAGEIRRERYDAVFCTSERAGIPLGILKPNIFPGTKLVVADQHPLADKKGRIVHQFNLVAGGWDKTFVVCQSAKEAYCAKYHVGGERVGILTAAIDTDYYLPPENETAEPYIYAIGVNQRDYPTLLAAMRNLDLTCRINPTSPWEKAGQQMESSFENIQLSGETTPAEVRKAMRDCSFSVVPVDFQKRNVMSGITAVLLAGACGKAVIATDTPAMREYVIDGQTGILVPEHDTKAMHESIKYLNGNLDICREMGRKARNNVADNYSINKWVNRVMGVL